MNNNKQIFWRESAMGAELVEIDPTLDKSEKVLGAVVVEHGYAFPWAYNVFNIKIQLNCCFSEKIALAKQSVEFYLQEIGILKTELTHESTR